MSDRASFPDHFSKVAASYARHRPRYPDALVELLAGIAPAHGVAWDCGCGSGQLSDGLASRFERVIATDASAEQLAQAEPHPKVEYRCATAEASGLPDRIADAAIAAQAAHWFDLPAWHREVRRVTKPGSIVAAITYGNVLVEGEVGAIVGRFYRETAGRYWSCARALVDEGYLIDALPLRRDRSAPAGDPRELESPGFHGLRDDLVGGPRARGGRGPGTDRGVRAGARASLGPRGVPSDAPLAPFDAPRAPVNPSWSSGFGPTVTEDQVEG
jgi:SAM-dependent methyltransferase